MDIQFTEEQELLRNSVQRLLRDQYDFATRRKIVATEGGWSRAQWDRFAELGLLAAPLPEEFGGLGRRSLAAMIIMQEFGRNLVVEPFLETVILAAGLIDALCGTGSFPCWISEALCATEGGKAGAPRPIDGRFRCCPSAHEIKLVKDRPARARFHIFEFVS